MRLLVAAEGNTLDARVAPRFEKAPWYLLVDTDTLSLEAISNNSPDARRHIVPRAKGSGVNTVVAGGLGMHAHGLMWSNDMAVAVVHSASVREAVERLEKNELKLLGALDLRHIADEHTVRRDQRRILSGKKGGMKQSRKTLIGVTPRGQHHLQQLAGRGH